MNRTITVYDSSTQKKTVFSNVDINTLGEVKNLLSQNNINYANMDFMEGVSQTKLLNDNSALPNNIPYKGNITNDLLIYLTLKDKKMRSGIDLTALSRKEIMAYVRELGLCEDVKRAYGRNYTQVSTENLIEIISMNTGSDDDIDNYNEVADIVQEEESKPADEFKEVLLMIAEQFGLTPVQMVALFQAVLNEITTYLVEETQVSEPSNFSDKEIQDMISKLR